MSAVAEMPAAVPAAISSGQPAWSQRLASLDRSQRLRLGLGLVLLVAAAIAAVVLGRQQDYRVLFSNLSDKDGGAIIAQLTQMNVPYRHTEGGGAITVPADRVHDVRLRLASQGLPKGTVSGFELMESGRFGMTQFQERLNFQRGLEGELTRSIQSLSSVQSARVHLALPQQNGFFREQQKPSASILVSLYPGRTLDRAQLAGIVHLVASSVPEMQPSAVSVLDDTGKLLSQSPDGTAGNAVDAQQLLYVQQIEQQYTRRIMDILEPVVGRNNIKAQVTAELDFSQTDSTQEQFRPNQAPEVAAVRSQQVLESSDASNAAAAGVAGAVSNQPPAPSQAPINGPNPAPQAAGQQTNKEANATKRESTTNYEVDKTVRVTRGGNWAIKRVNAAVVLNFQSVTDAKGKVESKPLSPEQMEKMTALVRETVGYNKDRGDSVNLMNAPFQQEAAAVDDTPLWKQPETQELARSLAWPLGMGIFGLIVLFGLVRPALKALGAPKAIPMAGAQLDAVEGDTPDRPALPSPAAQPKQEVATPEQLRLEEARSLARSNPVAVANIVKNWVGGEA